MTRLFIVLWLLLLLLPAAWGEVSVELDQEDYSGLIVMGRGGGDGGAPWPWAISREIPEFLALNGDGDDNGDGQAAFAIDPQTSYPTVVWAWFDGNDFEVVLSRWTGNEWSCWQLLTHNDDDDLDPAVTIDETGQHHVSWWRSGDFEQVWGREGDPIEGLWSAEDQLSGDKGIGQRPSGVWHDDTWVVAYEADPLEAGYKLIQVARIGEQTTRELIGLAVTDGPETDIDVQAHLRGEDLLWVDWLDAPGVLAWSLYDPQSEQWSATEYLIYSWGHPDEEYIEREFARGRLRRQLMAEQRRKSRGVH